MQHELQNVQLNKSISIFPQPVADSILQLKQEIAFTLMNHDPKMAGQKLIA